MQSALPKQSDGTGKRLLYIPRAKIPGSPLSFTGVDAPYEAPETPEIHVRTAEAGIADCAAAILDYVLPRRRIAAPAPQD